MYAPTTDPLVAFRTTYGGWFVGKAAIALAYCAGCELPLSFRTALMLAQYGVAYCALRCDSPTVPV